MKIAADANVLVRAIVIDDLKQSRAAQQELERAESVAVPIAALCETVWVLSRGYGFAALEIANVIRKIINSTKVAVNRPAVEAGLDLLDAGGDFADGVIEFEGRWLGADEFVSFDQKAVKLIAGRGQSARLLK